MPSNSRDGAHAATVGQRLGKTAQAIPPRAYGRLAFLLLLALLVDGFGMTAGALTSVVVALVSFSLAYDHARRVQPPMPKPMSRSFASATASWLSAGLKVLLLAPLTLGLLFVVLTFAHGPSRSESALEEGLRRRIDAGATRIPLAEVLHAQEGTVCIAAGAFVSRALFADNSWAIEALSTGQSVFRQRSFFAPDDYTVFRLALRRSDGDVQTWEMSRSSVGALGPLVWPTRGGEPAATLGEPCAPVRSAVLQRASTRQLTGYVLFDAAKAPS